VGFLCWSWFVFILRRHVMDRTRIADVASPTMPRKAHRPFSHESKYARANLVCLPFLLVYPSFSRVSCEWHWWILYALVKNILPWRGHSVQPLSAFIIGRIDSCLINLRSVRRWITGRGEMHHSLCSIERRKCFLIAVY